MYGRYGTDQLNRGLIWIYLVIILLAAILGRAVNEKLYTIISLAGLLIIIFAFFRTFSKNLEKRRAENAKWLRMTGSITKESKLLSNRWKFRKTHIFRKCPNCKAVLRLKKSKGKHSVVCPHCKTKFSIKVSNL